MRPTAPVRLWRKIAPKLTPLNLFLLLIPTLLGITLIAALFTRGTAVWSLFFLRGQDLFMDFFNSARDLFLGTGAYTERLVIYPPMANLIFQLFSLCIPNSYLSLSFAARMRWPDFAGAWVAILLFLVLLVALLFAVCCWGFRHPQKRMRAWVALCAVLSGSVLFGLERGNIAVLSCAATLFFLFSLEHPSKWVREFGLLALAFAFSLKLYPAVFGWLLITNRRYREAVRCALYGVLLLLIPSFFYGGPICLWWMVENLLRFSSWQSSGAAAGYIPAHLWMRKGFMKVVYYGVIALSAGLFVVTSFLRRREESRFEDSVFLSALVLALPSVQTPYVWFLLLYPFLLLLQENRWRAEHVPYYVLILIPLLPLPLYFGYRTLVELILPTVSLLLLLLCAADTLWRLYRQKKKRAVGE